MINEKYTERWRKKCGYFRQHIDNPNNNSEYLIRVWKKLNIRKQPWIGLIKMQDNGYFVGPRRGMIMKDYGQSLCPICKPSATISHTLHGCSVNKNDQTEIHDYICIQIYKKVILQYDLKEDWYEVTDSPHMIENHDKSVTVFFNKDIIKKKDILFVNRPYVCVIDGANKLILLMDATMGNEKALPQLYMSKIRKYNTLKVEMKKQYDISKCYIIPVVISTNGLIYQISLNLLKRNYLDINWVSTIRK